MLLFLHFELLDFADHVLDVLVDAKEVGVEDTFSGFTRWKAVELRKRDVAGFLFGNLIHVKVGLAVELRGLELLSFLNIDAVSYSGLRLHEVACHLSTNPAGRQEGTEKVPL